MSETVLENAFEFTMNVIDGVSMIMDPIDNDNDHSQNLLLNYQEVIRIWKLRQDEFINRVNQWMERFPIYFFILLTPPLVVFYQRQKLLDLHVIFNIVASVALLWPIAIIHACIVVAIDSKQPENIEKKSSEGSMIRSMGSWS